MTGAAGLESFDYVVVGGGSAGCIVAAELSRDGKTTVLLLECGDPAEKNPETLRADGYKNAFINDRLIWERFSVRQPSCGNQRLFMGSGRGVGGSGSVNGMVYTRGAREDFAEWPEGWNWSDVEADFERVEAALRPRPRPQTRFNEAFIESAEQAGFHREQNLNSGNLSGAIGYEHMNYEEQERRSSYVAFLREARERKNLRIETGARAERVLFAGTRATGVRFVLGAETREAEARSEVILCAGALESPKILMLSGVGPAEHLRKHGIDVVLDSPGVGENLHDHPNVTLFFVGNTEVDSNHPQLYGFHRANPDTSLPKEQADTCYVAYPARSSLREAAMRLVPTMVPAFLYGRFIKAVVRALIAVVFFFGFVRRFIARTWGIVVILGKPRSRGTLRLTSADPRAPAQLDPAYFAHPEDLDTMVHAFRLAERIAGAPSLTTWGSRPLLPGKMSDERALRKWIQHNAMTTYHYAGTCRMGDDPSAVVDSELRVRGLDAIRVADASVVPVTPVSAMNAPSMLIGARAARLVQQARR